MYSLGVKCVMAAKESHFTNLLQWSSFISKVNKQSSDQDILYFEVYASENISLHCYFQNGGLQ